MIPFARVLKYGNVLSAIKIVDVVTSYGNVFVIYNDGKTFGTGDNSVGELGQGNNTMYRGQWVEMTVPNIKAITCSTNSTIMITDTNRVYMTGSKLVFGNNTSVNVPEDITSLFSSFNLNQDKVIGGARGMFVLRANGDLYACGSGLSSAANLYGNVGVGTTSSGTFKRVGTNVKKVVSSISGSSECSIYLTNNNELYSTGRNSSAGCGLGYVGEVPTFTKVSTVFDSPVDNIFCTNSSSLIITTNGTIYNAGRRSIGESGDGNTSTTPTNYVSFTKNNVFSLNGSIQNANTFFNNDAMYIPNATTFYSTGLDYYGQFGIGNTAYHQYFTFQQSIVPIIGENFRSGGYFNYTWDGNVVYACGNPGWIPGAQTNVGTMTLVPIQPRTL